MDQATRKPKKEFIKYSEEHLKSAIDAVQSGNSSMRKAAHNNGLPFSTLNNKIRGKIPLQCKISPSSILSEAEENLLVNWIHAYPKKSQSISSVTEEDSASMNFTAFWNKKISWIFLMTQEEFIMLMNQVLKLALTQDKILGPVSFDNIYEVRSGNEREAITVMANFS
ncbi:hypothetical protein PR048_009309 [Dryococelus australis]|uniref:HTH psq-type domain-containing protein n=1 Tax=Dryococelus australis TaxID=614101 RepID=A0ABQ9HZH8_9NEOP|nr:hypothetical protein PR048_009309 [Dryococelus australis]